MTWDTVHHVVSSDRFKRLRQVVILLRFLSFSLLAHGGYLAGNEIGYRSLGNRTYEITYTLYTDQSGGCPGSLSPIEIRSAQCSAYLTSIVRLQTPAGEPVGPACNTTNSTLAFRRWTYTAIIQLPNDCPDWKISANECCRGASINTITLPEQSSLFTETWINTQQNGNSSLYFSDEPTFVLWSGQTNKRTVQTGFQGLDSVVVTPINTRTSSSNEVNYLAGYSAGNPVRLSTPIQIGITDGEYTAEPLQAETGILSLKATGYLNGHAIASIEREQRIVCLPSTNQLPRIYGVDGGNDFIIDQCVGTTFDHYFDVYDTDAGATISLLQLSGLPGANASLTQNRLRIQWNPGNSFAHDTTIYFTLKVTDNQCPVAGIQDHTFQLRIHSNALPVSMQAIITDATCANGSDGRIELTAGLANPNYTYLWNDGATGPVRVGMSSGNHQLLVEDLSTGCSRSFSFGIGFQHLPPTVDIGPDRTVCQGTTVDLDAGAANASFSWNDGSMNPTLTVNQSGYYHVTVTDSYGCTSGSGVFINFEICAGTEEQTAAHFNLYPNPASDRLVLVTGHSNTVTWSVYDLEGRIILPGNTAMESEIIIPVRDLASGIYLLRWADGDSEHTARFVHR